MNTNNDIESDEHYDDAMMTMEEDDDDGEGGEEEGGNEDENNRWALCIEHGGEGKEEEEKRKDPPELIPLNASSDEGRAALHARRKMKTMRYDAVQKNAFPAVHSVSVGTQTDGDEEMFDDNDAEQQNQRRVSSLGLNDTNAGSMPTKKIVLDDDDSSEEDEEVQTAAVKKKKTKTKTKTKKKNSSLETADTTLREKRGHCGFGVPGFAERQPLQMEDDEEEEEEEGELDDVMKEDTDFVTTAKRNRELNMLIDYNKGGKKTALAHRNRRDVFTPFASNPNNKILLKRIMIKAGNNARFFLSKVSKPFRKVTLREFGAMSSSDLEQGRVKAVKISELETPAQFALCVEHGLQLNDLVFAALADGGRLELLKYLHEEILPGKIYHCSLAVEYAAQNNHLETLKYLIECHDAPLCKDACWRAAWKGAADCARYLILERKCPFDRNECHDIAYQYGHFDLARWIKEH